MPALELYEMQRIPAKRRGLDWAKTKTISWQENVRVHNIANYRRYSSRLSICAIADEPLPVRFKRLLTEWRKQTAHLSSIKAKIMVPSYLEIIGMGQPALPLILNELKQRPSYLFPALRAITGTDPVNPGDRGNLKRMANAWVEWGRQHNIIE